MSSAPSDSGPRQARFILVVGPSGAGKDALMERARMAFRNDPNVVFARRIVTRPAAAEDHDTLDDDAFVRAEREGAYLISWRAHDLCYGLPASLRDDLRAGRTVIANVSRAAILEAESLGFPVTVLHVTADPAILAARVAGRGRETLAQVRARLSRTQALHVRRAEIIEVRNEDTIDHGAALFIDAVRRCISPREVHAG